VLNHGLQRGAAPSVAHEILRTALRVRRFYLPWLTSTTAAAVLVTNPLDAASIMLNLLAVAFITEVDGMVASLVLPPFARRRADPFMEGVQAGSAWLNVRLIAFSCSIMLVFLVVCMDQLLAIGGVFEANMFYFFQNNPEWMWAPGCNQEDPAVECYQTNWSAPDPSPPPVAPPPAPPDTTVATAYTPCNGIQWVLQVSSWALPLLGIFFHFIGSLCDPFPTVRTARGGALLQLITDLAACAFGAACVTVSLTLVDAGEVFPGPNMGSRNGVGDPSGGVQRNWPMELLLYFSLVVVTCFVCATATRRICAPESTPEKKTSGC